MNAYDDRHSSVLTERLHEEVLRHHEYAAAAAELDDARERVAMIDDAIATYARAAHPTADHGRRVNRLTLERGRTVAQLAGARANLVRQRARLVTAMQRRQETTIHDATAQDTSRTREGDAA